MPKRKIILPRVDKEGKCYISYSQHSKWKRDKKDYIKSYFFGERFEGNAYTDFGSKVGEALENNDFSGLRCPSWAQDGKDSCKIGHKLAQVGPSCPQFGKSSPKLAPS